MSASVSPLEARSASESPVAVSQPFRAVLRALMASQGLDDRVLATRLGIDRSSVTRWLSDNPTTRRVPDGPAVTMICAALEATPEEEARLYLSINYVPDHWRTVVYQAVIGSYDKNAYVQRGARSEIGRMRRQVEATEVENRRLRKQLREMRRRIMAMAGSMEVDDE